MGLLSRFRSDRARLAVVSLLTLGVLLSVLLIAVLLDILFIPGGL